MIRSIRARLLIWYAVVLTVVVLGFATILYGAVHQARVREIDTQLESAAMSLDATLRRFPPPLLERADAEPPSPPWDRPPFDRPPPPRHGFPSPAMLLAELAPPQGSFTEADPQSSYFVIWRADGSILKTAGPRPDPLLAPTQATAPPRIEVRGTYREISMLGPGRTHILVGRSTAKLADDEMAFVWQLAGVGGGVLLVGLAGGWLISARILRPIAAISAAASHVTVNNLSARIPVEGIDRELLDLAHVLNGTFDRLHAAFDQLTRFTADASHELRTPLTVIRTHAQLALTRPRSVEDYRQTIETCLQAAGRMTAIVEGLLTLARADAGKLGLRKESVSLSDLVTEGADLVRPLAEARGIGLQVDVTPVDIAADREALTRIISNLLSNAVRYNRPGGAVCVHLGKEPTEVVLSVRDTGVGIPEADQAHIFDRFFRVDRARSRSSGGMGLGLAICRSLAEAHGGTIDCESRKNEGSTFRLRLPVEGEG